MTDAELSSRERQILIELAAGHTYEEIAARTNLSRHTVDTYIRRIRSKTGINTRPLLFQLATRLSESNPE
jgi:DNA-binding CsgD family transcriptional regulator